MASEKMEIKEDLLLVQSTFEQIRSLLRHLGGRERLRIIHSLLDAEAAMTPADGYQLIANFVNDRLLVEKGPVLSAEYWKYLASTRTDPRMKDDFLKSAQEYVIVEDPQHAGNS